MINNCASKTAPARDIVDRLCCTGTVVSPKLLWLILTVIVCFVWALSSVLQDTIARDIQSHQAALLVVLSVVTLACTLWLVYQMIDGRKTFSAHTKIKGHIWILYSFFAFVMGGMKIYWVAFKIIFNDCPAIIHVDFTAGSGNFLYGAQVAYALVDVLFPWILAVWLTFQHYYNAPKSDQNTYLFILFTLAVKTLYVYTDEAHTMVGHVTKHACSNSTTGPHDSHAVNCTHHKSLYAWHLNLLEPLDCVFTCEGLTTFLAVVFLLEKTLDENHESSEHETEHPWNRLYRLCGSIISCFLLAPCKTALFVVAVLPGVGLSIGTFYLFIQLFLTDDTDNTWHQYLTVRLTMFTLAIVMTIVAYVKSSCNRPALQSPPDEGIPKIPNLIPTCEQFDIKFLFYSMIMGPIPFFLLTLYAGIAPWDRSQECYDAHSRFDGLQVAESLPNLIQVISQYLFIATAIEFRTFERRAFDRRRVNQSFAIEVAALAVLGACQFVMWGINSGSKHIIAKINITGRDYYPTSFWALAMALIYPSDVFFRAHGFILSMTLIHEYWPPWRRGTDQENDRVGLNSDFVDQHDYNTC